MIADSCRIRKRLIYSSIFPEIYPDYVKEVTPDVSDLKFKPVSITIFVDNDHAHYLETRQSVTMLHFFINKTPIQWHIRRKSTMETSTYGSKPGGMIITQN